METLPLTWSELESHLADPNVPSRKIPGPKPTEIQQYFTGPLAGDSDETVRERKGLHFFKIRYKPREIVVHDGVYSDYAGVQLQGVVRVFGRTQPKEKRPTGPERAEFMLEPGQEELGRAKSVFDESGAERPVIDRFMGVTSALWNLPRWAREERHLAGS